MYTGPVRGYQPVIVMHGILSSSLSMDTMVNFIKSAHSGTEVLNVDLFNDLVCLVYTCIPHATIITRACMLGFLCIQAYNAFNATCLVNIGDHSGMIT